MQSMPFQGCNAILDSKLHQYALTTTIYSLSYHATLKVHDIREVCAQRRIQSPPELPTLP